MNRIEFINKVNSKLRLIRTEQGYTQDKMAEILGISKKTLVQVEKERCSLSWAAAIAVCVIFKDSEILELTFGGDVEDIIRSLSFENHEKRYIPTMGGKIWWKDILSKGGYTIQQNMISNHYRILDNNSKRVGYSFELDYMKQRLEELAK